MKKVFLITTVAVALIMGISSCSKCQICTKTNSPEVRVCENDYNTATQYGLVIDGYQASGYVCKASI